MVLPPIMRRQRPGIRAQQTTISLPSDYMETLRKEAFKAGMSVSLYIATLVRESLDKKAREAA